MIPIWAEDQAPHPTLAQRFAAKAERIEAVTLVGPASARPEGFVASISTTRPVLRCEAASGLRQACLIAWISGCDLYLAAPCASTEEAAPIATALGAVRALGLRVFLHVTDRGVIGALPSQSLGPVISLPRISVAKRIGLFQAGLGQQAERLDGEIQSIARDFALEPAEIARVTSGISDRAELDGAMLRAVCRTECSLDFQGLAEKIDPVWTREDIVLPPGVDAQFNEAMQAIRGAGHVRHAWGERGGVGIGLLFAGPPGTGKTMGAQVIASAEDLPLFRVDLSQIVNKNIGETEKNLKRVFDTAEKMRCILFFDEAEALFGSVPRSRRQ